jgi:AraC-like DNA-binding protein
MLIRHGDDADFEFQHPGFSAYCHKPSSETRHRHNDLEISVSAHAGSVCLFGGRQINFPADRLVAMWGAMPHMPLRVEEAAVAYGVRVPLHWVLQWKLPEKLVRRLLNFDVIVDRKRESPCSDLALLKHWVRLMQSRQEQDREIVLLEIHARLLRLASEKKDPAHGEDQDSSPSGSDESSGPASGGLGLFERILQIVTERYHEPLSIPEIARALQVSRTHVMRHFRKVAGITLLEYITQHRVSCAQRLMATTDMKIIDIANESGFSSQGQFYSCFKRLTGEAPARYRRSMRL